MKGKCYSKVNMGQRNKKDYYQTPYLMTESLLDKYPLHGSILEPACGDGAIVKVLNKKGYGCKAYDLKQGIDFFSERKKYDIIITNPPYSLANKWILKCKEVAIKEFILLLPLNYLQGQWRYENIYKIRNDFSLKLVFIFSRMPTLTNKIRFDRKYKTGMQAYAWYIWEKGLPKSPVINWIDSKNHIVRKSL